MKNQVFVLLAILSPLLHANDWPTYGHDNRRSMVTQEVLRLPLKPLWIYQPPSPHNRAWTAPAKWDAYTTNEDLQSMRNFDPAPFVTASKGRVYFGSTSDHAIHCLDAADGKTLWRTFTQAPVRFPPTLFQGKALAGSDDGRVYSLNAETGTILWTYSPAPDLPLIANNEILISPIPSRSSVLVHGGLAYATFSLMPWATSWICALDPENGKLVSEHHAENLTLQGALLASEKSIYAPQGRAPPLLFDLKTCAPSGKVGTAGGVTCILTPDEQLLAGPANQKEKQHMQILATANTKERTLTFAGAERIVLHESRIYLHRKGALSAYDRQAPEKPLWEKPMDNAFSMVLAGDVLICGLANRLEAHSTTDGSILWAGDVQGTVYGLAVAGGRLFASSDNGIISAFGP